MTGPITGTSAPFSLTVGAPTQLVFTTQPVGGVTEGTTFAAQPVVTVEDSGSNPVSTDNGTVALSVGTYAGGNGGNTQGTLGCTATTVNANAGVAAFPGCQITGPVAAAGTYTLAAARSGLATGTSANVTITAGTATKLGFSTQPGGGVSEGTNLAPTPVVSVQDTNGNTVTTDNGTVALSIATYTAGNGGTTKGALGCANNTVSADAGVASFANCKITGTEGAGTYTFERGSNRAGHGELFERDDRRRNGGQAVVRDAAQRRGQRGDLRHSASGDDRRRQLERGHLVECSGHLGDRFAAGDGCTLTCARTTP